MCLCVDDVKSEGGLSSLAAIAAEQVVLMIYPESPKCPYNCKISFYFFSLEQMGDLDGKE